VRSDGWNFADVWEWVADHFGDETAQLHGGQRTTWGEMDRRADGLAATLLAAGAQHQDNVAHYLYNAPAYLESMFGLYKAGLVPVNTNYRYGDEELVYLWTNADAVAVIFHASLTERVERVRQRVPGVRTWLHVADASGVACPDWAVDYEQAASSASRRTVAPWGRSGDDLYILYTGGTTGMPKGVMWRQDDVIASLDATSRNPLPAEPSEAALAERLTRPGPLNLPAAPLMHGTGAFNAMWNLTLAGSVVTLESRTFDVVELLDTCERERVRSMSIVGDAFARPILRALDAEPDRWDISALRVIVSSGVMWSAETKAGLLRHNPRLIMVDSLGSSEAISMANATTTAEGTSPTARFRLGPHTRVLTEDGRDVVPGSGERGRVALRGRTPVGYYKDPEKSAATFAVIDGVRYSIPGDWAEVAEDGAVVLLGRGSQSINTGGEKVYPEEVEEVLKRHPAIADAAVVGVPDERFGEAITALVEVLPGQGPLDAADVIAHVKVHLASYKAPKRVIEVPTVGRAANGKLDYRRLKAEAERDTAASTPARGGVLPEPPQRQ
jgi:acyl-CoA synthetase (AMP-forming)/AMP-acid ligase II